MTLNKPSNLDRREYLVQNIQVVDIETSTACNRKCNYCPNVNHDNGLLKNNSLMSIEIFSKIVTDLGKEGYSGEICLQRYNEPLLDTRITQLVGIASLRVPKATIVIYSNGDYLTIPLFQELLEAGLNKLTVTQHGDKPSKGLIDVMNYRENNSDNLIFKYKKMDSNGKFYNRGGEIALSSDQPRNFFCKTLTCVTINSKGQIILCCNDYHSQHIFGDAGVDNVIDICLGKSFQSIRMEAVTGYFSREICNICMYGK